MPTKSPGPYAFFMVGLCVLALAIFLADLTLSVDQETARLLIFIYTILFVFFLADFLATLVRVDDRCCQLLSWAWQLWSA